MVYIFYPSTWREGDRGGKISEVEASSLFYIERSRLATQ